VLPPVALRLRVQPVEADELRPTDVTLLLGITALLVVSRRRSLAPLSAMA